MDASPRRESVNRWLLALGCAGLLVFFFSPSWAAFRLGDRVPEFQGLLELRRGASVRFQAEHLGAPIPDTLHGAIQWRLLFPALAHFLGLPAGVLFALPWVGGVAALGFVIGVLRRRGLAWTECACAAVVFGATSWWFASFCWRGYFDTWLVLALAITGFSRARWAVWAACVWGPWVDERFVLGAPLALLCAQLLHDDADAPARRDWKLDLAVPAALLAAFVVVRLGVLAGGSAKSATIAGYLDQLKLDDTPGDVVALGVWEGLRAGWLFAVAAVALSWRRRGLALALAAGTALVAVVALATAQDFSRSLMLLAPVALLGLVRATEARPRWLGWALRGGAAAALLLPAHLVMNDRVNPVYYLHHELAALRSPPRAAMPELYELRAIEAMQAGDLAKAESELTMAIKLSDRPVSALKQRGVLYASNGRWPDARKDFDAMVAADSADPDGWFFRAQAGLALGDVAAARADFEHALERATPEWKQRADVGRFQARLKQTK